VPVAGATLLPKIWKGLKELRELGLIPDLPTRLYAAQAAGCAPVVTAILEGSDIIRPVKPNTIAKSLAIGNPADGYEALKTVAESGGSAAAVTDEEIIQGMLLLARTQGVFTETAGGVTVAATRKLIEEGVIPRDESVVICVTGNGLKTQEAVTGRLTPPTLIEPTLASFESEVKDL
jgi:threonine synthase